MIVLGKEFKVSFREGVEKFSFIAKFDDGFLWLKKGVSWDFTGLLSRWERFMRADDKLLDVFTEEYSGDPDTGVITADKTVVYPFSYTRCKPDLTKIDVTRVHQLRNAELSAGMFKARAVEAEQQLFTKTHKDLSMDGAKRMVDFVNTLHSNVANKFGTKDSGSDKKGVKK